VESIHAGQYCEFEKFFENDLTKSLNISSSRIHVLFVKAASQSTVLVHFRLMPSNIGSSELTVTEAMLSLTRQIRNPESSLYRGNVTVRTDSGWGLGGSYPASRVSGPLFDYKYYTYDSSRLNDPERQTQITPYDRCKMNRRCNWGITGIY
jgi:hypothetical protein